jgi:hypothetical protein
MMGFAMDFSSFVKHFSSKDGKAKEALLNVLARQNVLSFLVEALFAWDRRVQFESLGVLRMISINSPGLLYPYLNSLLDLLKQPNDVLREDARFILAQIKRVDSQNKLGNAGSAALAEDLFGLAVRPI